MLILGFAGSLLAAGVLYISAEGTLADNAAPAVIAETLPVSTSISLPAAVPGTTLQIAKMSSYEGPFLEDGSDKEVVNVAALHVFNTGNQEILKACITLQYGNVPYIFYGEHLPSGETVVLLEREGKAYQVGGFTHCSGWQETSADTSQEGIMITDRSMGTLIVTNLTDKTFQNVCLYYKSWLSPPDVYMGGITYTAELSVLLPGEVKYLYPSHYAAGYSKVVLVTADL